MKAVHTQKDLSHHIRKFAISRRERVPSSTPLVSLVWDFRREYWSLCLVNNDPWFSLRRDVVLLGAGKDPRDDIYDRKISSSSGNFFSEGLPEQHRSLWIISIRKKKRKEVLLTFPDTAQMMIIAFYCVQPCTGAVKSKTKGIRVPFYPLTGILRCLPVTGVCCALKLEKSRACTSVFKFSLELFQEWKRAPEDQGEAESS